EFYRVGGNYPITVDVRIIAATHRDLKERVRQKKFREDLFYRLHVVPIDIPPLRERRRDIQPLIFHYLEEYNSKYNFKRTINNDALERLISYDWPGNIRELQNTIERLVVTVNQDLIENRHLPRGVLRNSKLFPALTMNRDKMAYQELLDEYERNLLLEMKKYVVSTKELGERIGIDPSTVRRKFNKFNISFDFNDEEA